MPQEVLTRPVADSVAKVDGDIAVGEDLDFQRKWWRFENGAWFAFSIIILLDLAGAFGRGPLAKAKLQASDGSAQVHYERIERTNSPSILTVQFAPSAIHDGKIELYVSDSLVKALGTQRVIPAPQSSLIGNGGITYTFPASVTPASVDMALQPSGPGVFGFKVGVVGSQTMQAKVFVVP